MLQRSEQKDKAPAFAREGGASLPGAEGAPLATRLLDMSQDQQAVAARELASTPVELTTPRPRYDPVTLKRLRTIFFVLAVLAVGALIVDSVLAFMVLTHKPAAPHRATARHVPSSLPPVLPLQSTQVPDATAGPMGDSGNPGEPGATSKGTATSSALSGQLAPSQGGGGPLLAVSSSSLSFRLAQGQSSASAQVVTLVNTGVATLNWQAASSNASWLTLSSAKGTIAAGQSGQIKVNIVTASLNPGSYTAQITITGTDSTGMEAQGSPQIVSVVLTIAQPCALQVSPGSIAFTGTTLQLGSSAQTISLKEVGSCPQPVTWTASADAASRGWLNLSSTSGSDSGSGSTITVSVNANGMLPGSYQGQVTCSATDNGGAIVQGSPQHIAVTLNVKLAGVL